MKKIFLSILLVFGLFGCSSDLTETPDLLDLSGSGSSIGFGECVLDMKDIVFEQGVTSVPVENVLVCSGTSNLRIYFEKDANKLFLIEGAEDFQRNVNSGIGSISSPVSVTFSINPEATFTETQSATIIVEYYNKDWKSIQNEYTITAIK